MTRIIFSFFLFYTFNCFCQSYTSYFTGNVSDIVTIPSGGVCLMGGSTEDDNAMKWFLQQANGGDVLVLRTSGADGYNSYFYSDLGVVVNSVETIVCNNSSSSSEAYILQKIQNAEAIWFAGGNQWIYISYWRNTPMNQAINQAIKDRNIVIGGTSAGMAIQGKYIFSTQNGTVSSATALANPYNNLVTIDSTAFLENDFLTNVITDTHFDNPSRKGRLVSFLARIKTDYNVFGKAIACDESTAVCIDTNGIAKVFGGSPNSDDNAYFIQPNCGIVDNEPENCTTNNPLTWNLSSSALKVYQIKGTASGINTFDLNSWQSGNGGVWNNWSVNNGAFFEQQSDALNCNLSLKYDKFSDAFYVYPNPTFGNATLSLANLNTAENLYLTDQLGNRIKLNFYVFEDDLKVNLSELSNGIYFLISKDNYGQLKTTKIIKN
jgi:cyanophycinase-like exopeptidase